MSSHEHRVVVEVGEDGVADVRMVRGDKHNGLDLDMFRALDDTAQELAQNPRVRAVVLHGEGKSFCSGIDIQSLAENGVDPQDLLNREDGQIANLAQRVATGWIDVPVPVIAAIHGNCFGGGLQIALGADIRIVAPDAKLSIMEIRWGLVPDMGITQTLPRLLPLDVAKELTWTGRKLSGEEAAELGVATRTAPDPLAAALDLAREIAGKSPDAIRSGKKLYDAMWESDDATAALKLESELQSALMGSPNQMEAVRAGFMKEEPSFQDPAPAAAV